MTNFTFIVLNSIKFYHCPFIITLDKYSGSCDAVDKQDCSWNLSTFICEKMFQKYCWYYSLIKFWILEIVFERMQEIPHQQI